MKLLPPCTCLTVLLLFGIAAAPARAEPRRLLAQAEIRIPSDNQLEQMERQGITTPPLYDGKGTLDGGIAAENRQMTSEPIGLMRGSCAVEFAAIDRKSVV